MRKIVKIKNNLTGSFSITKPLFLISANYQIAIDKIVIRENETYQLPRGYHNLEILTKMNYKSSAEPDAKNNNIEAIYLDFSEHPQKMEHHDEIYCFGTTGEPANTGEHEINFENENYKFFYINITVAGFSGAIDYLKIIKIEEKHKYNTDFFIIKETLSCNLNQTIFMQILETNKITTQARGTGTLSYRILLTFSNRDFYI